MQLVISDQLSFEVTYDSPSLDVAMSVYDTSTGTPTLVSGPSAMAVVVGNTYFAQFTPTNGKQYVIHKAVYTDGTFTTLDGSYAQGSESILCNDASAGDTAAIAAAVWDQLTAGHTVAGSYGVLAKKWLTLGKFLGLK